MKGVSSLIASVMLILVTVVSSIFISGWLTSTTNTQTTNIKNTTNTQLQCQFADIYVKNATYNCGGSCSSGTHNTTVTVVNSGKRSVSIDKIYLRNTTGSLTILNLTAPVTLKVSDITEISNVSVDDCSGIKNAIEFVTIVSSNCPSTAYDNYEGNQVVYLNC